MNVNHRKISLIKAKYQRKINDLMDTIEKDKVQYNSNIEQLK